MKMPEPAASMRYSGQCFFSAFNMRNPVSVFGSIHRGRDVTRNVMPIRPHNCKAASKRYQRHAEQQSMIALNRVTQPSHVTENGCRHRAGGEDTPRPPQS